MIVDSVAQLRALYPHPTERIVKKQLSSLDRHCQRIIELSPFVVIASGNADFAMDASPRGGAPGFVKVTDPKTLLIPDAPGNNRLDTFENIIATRRVGLLFLVPGLDETLRVNGAARLSRSEALIGLFAAEKRPPKLVIEVTVHDAYLHCPKALMRSDLWNPAVQIDRKTLPTVIEMINDQTGIRLPVQSHEATRANFEKDL